MPQQYWMLEQFDANNVKLGAAAQAIPFEQQRACARAIPNGWHLSDTGDGKSFVLCTATNIAVQLPVLCYLETLLLQSQKNPSKENVLTVALCRVLADQTLPVGVLIGNLFGPGVCGTAAVCKDISSASSSVDSLLSSLGVAADDIDYRSIGLLSVLDPILETDSCIDSRLLSMLSRTDVPIIQAPFTADALQVAVERIQSMDVFVPPYVDHALLSTQHIPLLAYGLAMQLIKRITVPFYEAHKMGATASNLEEAAAHVYAITTPSWDAVLLDCVVEEHVKAVQQSIRCGFEENENADPSTLDTYEDLEVSDEVKAFRRYCMVAAAQLLGLRQLIISLVSFYDHSPLSAMLRSLSLLDIKSMKEMRVPLIAYSDLDLVLENKDAFVSELAMLSGMSGREVTGKVIPVEMMEEITEAIYEAVTPAFSSREELLHLGAFGLLAANVKDPKQQQPLMLGITKSLYAHIQERKDIGKEWAKYIHNLPHEFLAWVCQQDSTMLAVLDTLCMCGTAARFFTRETDDQHDAEYLEHMKKIVALVLPSAVRSGYSVTDSVLEMNALPRESS